MESTEDANDSEDPEFVFFVTINIKDLEDEQTPRASSKRAKRSRNEGYIPRRVAFRTNIQDAKEWFDPRDPTLYKYYKKRQGMRPGSGMIRGKPTDGKVETGSIQNLRKVSKYTDDLVPVDSGLTSQENLDACSSVIGTDTMSTHDSGIGRDMSISVTSRSDKGWSRSDRSNASSVKFSTHNLGKSSRNLKDWSGTKSRLSPVKSSTSLLQYGGQGLKSLHPDGYNQQTASLSSEWQKFFQTPTALERKRMEMVRKDFNDGKMSHSGPSTIHYINDDIPRLPGEAGLRLLHTVRVGDKTMDGLLERHRVEAIPSKLSSQTKNKQQGQSQFGILKMKWTTDIPIPLRALQPDPSESESIISGSLSTRSQLSQNVPNNTPGLSENRSRRSQKSHDHHKHRSHDQDRKSRMPKDKKSRLPQIVKKYASKESLKMSKSQEADLWTLPSIPGAVDPGLDFVWDHPIPPAPERESRTNIPYIKKDHEHYCKYYNLVKKNLQKYTSSNQTPSLPQIEVTKALPASTAENKKDTLSRGPSLVFPPITLNQLISAK